MTKFKVAVSIFIGILAIMVFVNCYYDIGLLFFFLLFFSFLTVVIYGTVNIHSGFFIPALCKLKTDDKVVALTFDDGPSLFTNEILDVLKEYNVKAAFFCVGKNIENNPSVLSRIHNEGHIIGNHSYSHHFFFNFFSSKKIEKELQKTEVLIENLISKKVKLFRPPYGVTNPPLQKAVRMMNYTTIGWSVRSLDTTVKSELILLKRLKNKLKPGSIVLLHDHKEITKDFLKDFLDFLLQNNYKILRLDKMLNIIAYE